MTQLTSRMSLIFQALHTVSNMLHQLDFEPHTIAEWDSQVQCDYSSDICDDERYTVKAPLRDPMMPYTHPGNEKYTFTCSYHLPTAMLNMMSKMDDWRLEDVNEAMLSSLDGGD